MTERPYFSIGEVLGLLLEEFSDVTISKIRFLESQGLIDPERTSSGYRKFYDADVERLRYILREQKDNYLPLKVIKERLDDIDHTLPNPPRPMPVGASWASEGNPSAQLVDHEHLPVATPASTTPASTTSEWIGAGDEIGELAEVVADAVAEVMAEHPSTEVVGVVVEESISVTVVGLDEGDEAAERPAPNGDRRGSVSGRVQRRPDPTGWIERSPTPPNGSPRRRLAPEPDRTPAPAPAPVPVASSATVEAPVVAPIPEPPVAAPTPPPRPGAVLKVVRDSDGPLPADLQLTAGELCAEAGIDAATLRQLEEFGLLTGRALGTDTAYGPDALQVARLARRLLGAGLEVRHLRTWRMAAEKEASLFEQLVVPLLRQRNPNARQHAVGTLTELAELGGELRSLLVRAALGEYFDR